MIEVMARAFFFYSAKDIWRTKFRFAQTKFRFDLAKFRIEIAYNVAKIRFSSSPSLRNFADNILEQ